MLVYIDESYANVNHARQFTWFNLSSRSRSTQWSIGPDGCVLRAGVRSREGDDDYHNNMNGHIYLQWLSKRLLPVFSRRFPGQKMVLVLNNALCHLHRGAGWINPHGMLKSQLAAKLVQLGITSVSVQRQMKGTSTTERLQFDASTFERRGGRFAPTREELKAELQTYLAEHPEISRTEVAKLMAQRKHELLYTPGCLASSPLSDCGPTSRTTWPRSTRRAGR